MILELLETPPFPPAGFMSSFIRLCPAVSVCVLRRVIQPQVLPFLSQRASSIFVFSSVAGDTVSPFSLPSIPVTNLTL